MQPPLTAYDFRVPGRWWLIVGKEMRTKEVAWFFLYQAHKPLE